MALCGNGLTTTDATTGLRISANVTVHAPGENGGGLNATFATQVPASGIDVGFAFFNCGSGPGTIDLSCEGYVSQHLEVTFPIPTNINYNMLPFVPPPPPHVDPSNIPLRDLAKIRGSMWPVRGPWAFGPRPNQADNITALEFIYSYGDPMQPFALNDTQKAMIATYKSHGYTHCCFGPANAASYHGQYPDTDFSSSPEKFDKWLDWVQMFWDNGLQPVLFIHEDNATLDETIAKYTPLIKGNAKAQRVMRIVVPTGWEPTRYGWSSVTWMKYLQWAQDILPNSLRLIHTVADVDAPVGTDDLWDDNGKGNGQGWARVVPYLHGWLIQNGAYAAAPQDSDPEQVRGFAGQFDRGQLGADTHGVAWHFLNGIADWPRGSAWGPNEMIYLYNAECTSYEAYWNNLPYDASTAWGDVAMAHEADGYLDSGTVAVPPRA